jgi:hypothetical protein
MTELLQQAIAAVEGLPDELQDTIAALVLQEVADEQAWAGRFEGTTKSQWTTLARMARNAARTEPTVPLDDDFPGLPSV